MKKYAIFGGTFDPIHLGHVSVAKQVRDALELDEIIFVPNHKNPFKTGARASVTDRLRMCQFAVEGEPGLSVSDIEATRGGDSYTIETIEEFLMVKPGSVWIVLGADALEKFASWKDYEKLARRCRLAVVTRGDFDIESILRSLPESVEDVVDLVEINSINLSSTRIREELARGLSPELWLNPAVWEYISERGIYTS